MSRSPIWHPFTQHALASDPLPIARAEGAWLETKDGRRIFDAISSWWVTTHGHCHPKIMAAIRAQTEKLDQVIFAGFTHEPAEELARRLIDLAPGQDHVFFSDSGSVAVEVALKMALGYWRNKGEARTKILALEGAYHGDTTAAMSAGARGVFNAAYEPMLFEVERIPFPDEAKAVECLHALDAACAQKPAALIVEPLLLGAGGMRMYQPYMLAEMKRVCESHGVLFIADEILTGWGRTGTLFACDQAPVIPDIVCYAKGLTGGALPLAVTLCKGEIFDAHYSKDRAHTFFHSSSYTANPIACAAALANLDIWKSEPVLERIEGLSDMHHERLARLRADKRFSNVRHLGTIAAMDVTVADPGYMANIGPKLYEEFLKRDILLRPLGSTIYIMPPYCTTARELDAIYDAIFDVAGALAEKT